MAFSPTDDLTLKHQKSIRWISHKMTASVAWGLRTSNMVTKGWYESPDSPIKWNACETFGSDTAEWCRPSIEYQGCAEMKAIWYSQRREWGNEIDVVKRASRWWDAKRKSVEVESCRVGVLCWNGTQALTRYRRNSFFIKRLDPTQCTLPIGAGEMRGQFDLRNNGTRWGLFHLIYNI